MPTTTGSHPVPTISAPVNGTLIDANTVRGNDNNIRTAYNNHDADPGVHLQSSTFGARPVAGVVGRKWMTERDGRFELWYDTGTSWRPIAATEVALQCEAAGTIAKGNVLRLTGYNTTTGMAIVDVVSAGTQIVFGIAAEAITSGQTGMVMVTGQLNGVNTSGTALGNTLYSNGAGSWTATKPTTGEAQVVGVVLRVDAADGVLLVQVRERGYVDTDQIQPNVIVRRDSTGNILGSISGAAAAGLLTGTTIASNVVDSNLETFGDITEMEWNGVLYQLPPADGAAGEILSTDGAGNIDWVAPGAADAGILTGTTLAANVVNSSLESLGDLTQLTMNGVTYDLPTADGSAGQALTTDGAGVLAWAPSNSFPVVEVVNEDGTGIMSLAKDTEHDVQFTSKTIDTGGVATLGGGDTTITLQPGTYYVSAYTLFQQPFLTSGQEAIASIWLRRADATPVAWGPGGRDYAVTSNGVSFPLTISGIIQPTVATTYSLRVYATYVPTTDFRLTTANLVSGIRRVSITFIKLA